ncbi:MAG: phosphatase PAP2 family protein, partial [Mycobacterium sp.]
MKPSILVSLAAGLFAALAGLAVVVKLGWLARIDTAVAAWFGTHRSPTLAVADAGAIYDFIGVPANFAIFAVVISMLLSLRARSAIPFAAVIGAVVAAVAVKTALKALIERPPWTTEELKYLDDWTSNYLNWFPSGHIAGVSALLGMIAVCLATGSSRAFKVVLTSLVAAGVLFVALLAFYLGWHTFTDVLGGAILGGAIVSLG